MKKWKEFKGWLKGSVIGFTVLGIGHILMLTLLLYPDPPKGEGWIVFLFLEAPLVYLNYFFELLFGVEIFPLSQALFRTYVFGTIAWGFTGVVPGFILGFLSDLMRKFRVAP